MDFHLNTIFQTVNWLMIVDKNFKIILLSLLSTEICLSLPFWEFSSNRHNGAIFSTFFPNDISLENCPSFFMSVESCDGHLQGPYQSCDGHLQGPYQSFDGHLQGPYQSCDGHLQGQYQSCDGHLQAHISHVVITFKAHISNVMFTFKAHILVFAFRILLYYVNLSCF